MAELQKIVRVLKKVDAEAPHAVLLVLDATVGQNAHAQAEVFRAMVGVTGIVMTKLDGTAKGGVLVSLAEKYGIPIHAIGVGESADDLRPVRSPRLRPQPFGAGSLVIIETVIPGEGRETLTQPPGLADEWVIAAFAGMTTS